MPIVTTAGVNASSVAPRDGIGAPADEAASAPPPLHLFRFAVEFAADVVGTQEAEAPPLPRGAFSEISGLEATMEPKIIKEGGHNYGSHQRAGVTSFGTVVLKRGVTGATDLWRWFLLLQGAAGGGQYARRLTVTIRMHDPAATPVLKCVLTKAMPVKFKAADLSARATEVAIEELHLVHEGLEVKPP